MGNYFVLECYGSPDNDRAAIGEIVEEPDVNWNLGTRFSTAIVTPIEVHLAPEEPGLLMPMFERSILLMRGDMIAALRDAGVDNLDLYDAVVVDPTSGERHLEYRAVNIIGLVACADLTRSTYLGHGGGALIDADFEALTIDEEKAKNLPFFRLAECVSAKVIHRRVKEILENRIPYLDFVEPQNWSG